MTQSDLLTADEAAKLLRISRRTFDGHVAHGDIAYIAVGLGAKRVRKRFAPEDIIRFRERQRRLECPPEAADNHRRVKGALRPQAIDFEALLKERRAARRLARTAVPVRNGGR